MGTITEATLADGRRLPYVITEDPPRGGMKYTYFAPDKSYVVQFFNNPAVAADPEDPTRCLVDFSFAVAHGLNQIWLTAHITV